jgi:hypothetical protein
MITRSQQRSRPTEGPTEQLQALDDDDDDDCGLEDLVGENWPVVHRFLRLSSLLTRALRIQAVARTTSCAETTSVTPSLC